MPKIKKPIKKETGKEVFHHTFEAMAEAVGTGPLMAGAVKKVTEEPISLVARSIGSVTIEKSVTKNMGNYNSAKVTVGMTLPIEPTPEEVEQAKSTIKIVNEILDNELEFQVEAMMDSPEKTDKAKIKTR